MIVLGMSTIIHQADCCDDLMTSDCACDIGFYEQSRITTAAP